MGAPVGRHTLAIGSHHSVPGAQSAWLTAGEITVTNASGAIPAAATDAIRRTIFFIYVILPNGPIFKRAINRGRTGKGVREGGLEPPRPKTRAPKARASANFATRA